MLVVVRLAFAGTKAAWFGPAMSVAGIVFLLGILAAVVLGFMSASRTRAFIDSVAASLETLSPMPLGDGDRVGDLHGVRMPEGLTLDHRWGIVRLRATRVAMLMLALITGAGAGVLVVMLIGQGVSSTKGLLGVIGMGFLAVSVPFWMIAFRKPLAVRMRFDGVAGVLHVLALSGVFRTVRFELPYKAMVGVVVDHTEILGSRRVRLVVGDRVLEIARFPAPRTNSRSSSILGKRDADEAHDDLCVFRADRMTATFMAEVARGPQA
ncbi:MAG: hypothetical protein AB8F26_08975 [Phycisphaerales bacterium]